MSASIRTELPGALTASPGKRASGELRIRHRPGKSKERGRAVSALLANASKRPTDDKRTAVDTKVAARAEEVELAPIERHQLQFRADPSKPLGAQQAETLLSAELTNAFVALNYSSHGGGDVTATGAYHVMAEAAKDVRANDMAGMETVLSSQALALNSMFVELASRAAKNMGAHIEVMDTYLRLALKCQSQSRATIETLGTLKNPPVVFAKQANFASNQQVNNGTALSDRSVQPDAPSHDRTGGSPITVAPGARLIAQAERASAPTELLEDQRGKRMDFGTSEAAERAYSCLATLGACHRAANPAGKGTLEDEPLRRSRATKTARAGKGRPGDSRKPRARTR